MSRLFFRVFTITLALLSLAACRLVLSPDSGGWIASQSGDRDCAESSCEFFAGDGLVDSFVPVPEPGYRFDGWEGIRPCEGSDYDNCQLALPPLPPELVALDIPIPLSASFVPLGEGEDAWVELEELESDALADAQAAYGPTVIYASCGGDDFEDNFVFVAPADGDYDIVLDDYEQAGFDLSAWTEDGYVFESGSVYSGDDPIELRVSLSAGQRLNLTNYIILELEQDYTLSILPASEAPPADDNGGGTGGNDPDTFGFGTSGSGPTLYTEGESNVLDIDAFFSDDPEAGHMVIMLLRTNGSSMTLDLEGRTVGTYGRRDGLYTYASASGNVYQNSGSGYSSSVTLTSVGAVGEKIEGEYSVTLTLVGCNSCSNTRYVGSFSVTRSR